MFNRITLAQAALPLLLIGIAIGLGGGVRAAILATVVAVALLFVAVIVHVQRSTGIVWRAKLAYLRGLSPSACAYIPRMCSPTSATGSTCSSWTATRALPPSASTAPASSSPRASGCRRRPSARRSSRPSPRRRVRRRALRSRRSSPAARSGRRRRSEEFSSSSAGPAVDLLYPAVQRFRGRGVHPRPRDRPLLRRSRSEQRHRGPRPASRQLSNRSRERRLQHRVEHRADTALWINGAAWASTASYSLLFLATAAVYRRITHVPLRALIVPKREDGPRVRAPHQARCGMSRESPCGARTRAGPK